MLVDTFNTIENVILGAEKNFSLKENITEATQKLRSIEKNYNLPINYDSPVGELPVGERQRIEIFKALYRKAKILILDEPTGVLTPQEADNLFAILQTLKKEGVTIILITHKLKEIMSITDNVTVMRKGITIKSLKTSKITIKSLKSTSKLVSNPTYIYFKNHPSKISKIHLLFLKAYSLKCDIL